jgi:outer membrane protein TolC
MRVSLACAFVAGALSVFGQQALVEAPKFPQSSYFEQVINPPVPRVQLRDPVRLSEFVVNGKLELSLKNYVELVLANNTDIEIQRLTVEIPKNQILRAGAIFDPQFQGRFAATRSNSQTSDVLAGAATLSQLNQPWNFNYVQTLSTGTQVQVGFNGAKVSNNSQFQTFNPSYTANMAFSFTQPLLRGRGSYITKLPISVARSRVRQTEYNVQDQILRLLVQAETVYWNVIEARENLRVQEQALALNDAALKRAQRELELGATSPLEIFQPQAQYANAEIFVTQARYRLAQVEDTLRRQIGADLDPEIRKLPIVLTEPVTAPANGEEIDKEALVQKAMNLRPDLKAAMQALDIDELNLKSARNGLLPNLALGGGYTSSGRGGVFFPRTNFGGVQQVLAPIPGGLGDAFSQLFNFGYPIYNFSLTLNLPLRDRRAAADYADANIQRKRDMLQLRTTEQQIRLEVLNAINQVELSKASLKLAQIARDLAQKRVEAEQKKYELGTTVIFFVLAAQSDLTTAEAALVTQTVGYRRNLLTLLQRTGELLQERGVVLP